GAEAEGARLRHGAGVLLRQAGRCGRDHAFPRRQVPDRRGPRLRLILCAETGRIAKIRTVLLVALQRVFAILSLIVRKKRRGIADMMKNGFSRTDRNASGPKERSYGTVSVMQQSARGRSVGLSPQGMALDRERALEMVP